MTSAWVAVAARRTSRDRRPTRTNRACRAAEPPRRSRPAQRRPAGRGLSVVRRRRQGVLGTCFLHGIGLPLPARLPQGWCLARSHLRVQIRRVTPLHSRPIPSEIARPSYATTPSASFILRADEMALLQAVPV